jgi:membrane protease YdiL (CAAX protease family)
MAVSQKGEAGLNLTVNYWQESARPLVSLAFVFPMLLVYEGGMLLLGPRAMRNGADVWLRHLLEFMGFGQYFLLPIVTSFILLAWHHVAHQSWRIRWPVLSVMLLECAALGFLLLVFAQVQGALFASPAADCAGAGVFLNLNAEIGRVVGFFGAGIYEELLFRLMLLPAIAAALRSAKASQRASLIAAALMTSLLFSAAHYQLFSSAGEAFDWFSFLFRFLAGVFFALVFIFRGFGIAAGTHALYDIFVVFQ